jgi:dihydrofolate reductase
LVAEVGAMLTGRRTFEVAEGWGGQHPWDIPAFVVTHEVPDGWPRPGSTVQFVTDGIESAVARAKSAADPKSVGVHGAETIQQCLNAGLLDEIHIDLAAVLLGEGVRLFDHLANTPAVLGDPSVVAGVGVTHLRYPVHPS